MKHTLKIDEYGAINCPDCERGDLRITCSGCHGDNSKVVAGELARLRAIEEAAKAAITAGALNYEPMTIDKEPDSIVRASLALRDALEGKV